MVKRCFAFFMFGYIPAGDNGYIHHPSAAAFTKIGRLLYAVPKPAIMYRKIACKHIKADLFLVGVIIDKIFFAKQQFQHILFMRAGYNTQATVFVRAIIQVNAHI